MEHLLIIIWLRRSIMGWQKKAETAEKKMKNKGKSDADTLDRIESVLSKIAKGSNKK